MSDTASTPPDEKAAEEKPFRSVGNGGEHLPPEHNVDFQATFPGWPKEYFMGILPVVSLGAIYKPIESPGYDYTKMENVTSDTPYPNTTFKPTTPDPMYVTSMPWCAYPYGIPVHAPHVHRTVVEATTGPTELQAPTPPPAQAVTPVADTFLAVPTSREKHKQCLGNVWGA